MTNPAQNNKKITEVNKSANHPLQSWEWGEFRKAWGNEVVRTEHGTLTLHKIPFTNFKLGMLIRGNAPTKKILADLKNFGKENNLIFIKLEPNVAVIIWRNHKNKSGIENDITQMHMHPTYVKIVSPKKMKNLLKENGCVPGKTLFTPTSFWIDLTKSEDELMKGFSSKTRYNIRLAQKKGVKVTEDNSDEAFEKYLELTRETVERQGFYAHNERYHRLMWKHLNQELRTKNKKLPRKTLSQGKQKSPAKQYPPLRDKSPIAYLLTARYEDEVISAWILFVWKDFLYYPYGASSERHKNVMANNLMMWEAIRFGKKLGLKTFDLWGREPGKGFTHFKEGYNPQVVEFIGTWDLVINPALYKIYRIAESLRWPLLRAKSRIVKPIF